MKPLFETEPPFVIRLFDTYFHISSHGLFDKPEDRYDYKNIQSITIKKGPYNKNRTIVNSILVVMEEGELIGDTSDADELIIELKDGTTETRYFNDVDSEDYADAINRIKEKIR